MSNTLQHLKKICNIISRVTELDLELLNQNLVQELLISHSEYPLQISQYANGYYDDMLMHFKDQEHTHCYMHVLEDCALAFLDIQLVISSTETYYLCVGPVLQEMYTEKLVFQLMNHMNIPFSSKDTIIDFYKRVPCFSVKIKNALWVTYKIFQTWDVNDDFEEAIAAPITVTANAFRLSSEFWEEYTPTRDEIQLGYEAEQRWRAAITVGNSKAAKKALDEIASCYFTYQNSEDPFHVIKNIYFSVNGICRAAAMDGGAHALDLHYTYEQFFQRIENAKNILEMESISSEIVEAYCDLVISSRTKHYSPIVQKAISYLYLHYDQPLTLHSVAQQIHYSEGHLSREFLKETGKTLGGYLNELRIEQAIALLKSNSLSITDIAQYVGFQSYPKFSVEFKKLTGCSASQYLKQH